MTDELAKVLHDAARDSLMAELNDDDPTVLGLSLEWVEFAVHHLRFGERMALAVEMASILHDLTTGQTIAIPKVEGLLARWQERKP